MVPNIPLYSDAVEDAFAGIEFDDPGASAYSIAVFNRVDGKFFLKPIQDEMLAAHRAQVAMKEYRQTFTCIAGLAVGDPLYISANNTATKALATTNATSKVFSFCRYKPTATTCYVDHFRYISGLAGLTAGNPIFLSNTGTFTGTQGTIPKIVGVCISVTEAILFASPITAMATGTPDTIVAVTAALALTSNDLNTIYTNEGGAGAASTRAITLPSAVAGMRFEFYDQSGLGIRIVANAGDTIRIQTAVSAAAGYVESQFVGQWLILEAINATEWIAKPTPDTWSVV